MKVIIACGNTFMLETTMIVINSTVITYTIAVFLPRAVTAIVVFGQGTVLRFETFDTRATPVDPQLLSLASVC